MQLLAGMRLNNSIYTLNIFGAGVVVRVDLGSDPGELLHLPHILLLL